MMMMILVIREVCRAQEFKQAGQTLHNGVKPFLKSYFDLEASLFLDFPLEIWKKSSVRIQMQFHCLGGCCH